MRRNMVTGCLVFVCLNVAQPFLAIATENVRSKNAKEPFFACDTGFKFESRQRASRCIKQQKSNYRPPVSCKSFGTAFQKSSLTVDFKGINDACLNTKAMADRVDSKKLTIHFKLRSAQLNQTKTQPFAISPVCQKGFSLKARRGKDVCESRQSEIIKPPAKKVLR